MGRSPALLNVVLRAWIPVLTVVLLAILTLAENSATRQYIWPWFPAGQLLFALPIVYFLLSTLAGRPPLSQGRWLDAGLFFFSIGGLVCALLSPLRWQSVSLAAPYLFIAAVVYSISLWLNDSEPGESAPPSFDSTRPDQRLRKLAYTVGALIFAITLISYWQWLLHDVLPVWDRNSQTHAAFNRNGFPFGHSNYTAGFAVLSFSWLVCLAWRSIGFARIVWAIGALLTAGLVASTGSRGGVIGFLIELIGLLGFVWWKLKLSSGARIILIAAVVVAALAVILHEPRLRNLVIHHHWDTLATESNLQRQGMAEAGMLIGRAHPMTGIGPGMIPYVYPEFRARLSGGTENVLQVHNTYLELWAEMGFVGLLAMLLIVIGVSLLFRKYFALIAYREITDRGYFATAAGIGITAYAAFAVTDHQLDLPVIGFLLASYLAVLASSVKFELKPNRQSLTISSILGSAGLVSLLGLVIIFAWPNTKARHSFSEALDALSNHDRSTFLQQSSSAARSAPWDTAYINELAAQLIEERAAASTPAAVADLTHQIKSCFNFSLRNDPTQEYVHFNLGWIALDEGDPAAALTHFGAAARIVPDKGGVYLGMALALLAQDRPREASTALVIESLNDPAFLASPWWGAPELAALRPEVSQQLRTIYATLLSLSATSKVDPKQAEYSAALSNWLTGNGSNLEVLRATDNHFRVNYFETHLTAKELLAAPSFSYRRERTGYPVLMRHADLPPPHDVYVVRENAQAARELAGLFPNKGWLPTMILAQIARDSLPFLKHGAESK